MRLLHTGDLHLDARMDSVYGSALAKERRKELRMEWWRLVEYAAKNSVHAILIAGDLFDGTKPLQATVTVLRESVLRHPDIGFYYLRGNHDDVTLENMPQNFHTFTSEWQRYPLGDGVVLYGCEAPDARSYDTLLLNEEDVNIVMLHGQTVESGYEKDTVNLRALRRKGIDYLALGHIHKYSAAVLDERGSYAYCGCLVGRGFDECGEKGFCLVDIENGRVESRFVPFAERTVHELSVDLASPENEGAAYEALEKAVTDIPSGDVVRVLLPKGAQLSRDFVSNYLCSRFYYGEAKEAAFSVAGEAELFAADVSLRGEFVRTVRALHIPDAEKEEILLYGLAALRGEEADL